MNTELIIALSTPFGTGALAVIRLSGAGAIALVEQHFQPRKQGIILTKVESHTVHLGYLVKKNTIIDEVLVSVFKNPHSYTGEEVVEISCHGSVYLQQAIIQHFIENGARAAEPGEFTLRAFLNRKLDLSQTEAVADLIHAQSEKAAQVAVNQLRGGFSSDLKTLKEQLIHFSSLLELELDFSEEDLEFADRTEFTRLLNITLQLVSKLADSFKWGNAIKNGVNVAIVGKPNAGKSTLLNAILNEDRAIVTEIAGTTRDTLEETKQINGILFRFIDTAGLRQTDDIVEKIGVERALAKLRQSDIYLYVFDVTLFTKEKLFTDTQDLPQDIPHLIIGNKADLLSESTKKEILSLLPNVLFLSAKKQSEVLTLEQKILQLLDFDHFDANQTLVTNARHYQALTEVQQSLQEVLSGLQQGISGDLLAIDLRQALYYLGSITGEVTSDDILGNIFQNFCIGK